MREFIAGDESCLWQLRKCAFDLSNVDALLCFGRFEAPGIIEQFNKDEDERKSQEEVKKEGGDTDGGAIGDILGERKVSDEEGLECVGGVCEDGKIIALVGKDHKEGKYEDKELPPGPCGYCAVTGKPAKYRDPKSGQPYADVAAFKVLRGETDEAFLSAEGELPLREDAKSDHNCGGVLGMNSVPASEDGKEGGCGEEEEVVEPLFAQKKSTGWRLGGTAVA